MSVPLHFLSLQEVAARLKAKEISSVELTEYMLARIARVDPLLRSFARLTPDRAMAAARRADAELGRGEWNGPLHGVPIAVKDLCDTAGVVSAAGMPLRNSYVPERDATVVQRLEAAGAVLLGKLTMTEGASGAHHPQIPPPRNPWGLDRWAGASSSGSGAATAAGLCFASIGTDTAGSIRFPSAACGLTGIKPTYGRVSRAGVFPLAVTLDHVGPMARRTADAAALLQVIAGQDPHDPTSSHVQTGDYLAAGDGTLSGVRLGFDERYATADVDPIMSGVLGRSIAVLEAEGAKITAVELPPFAEALDAHAVILHADVARAHTELGLFPRQADAYGPHLREVVEIGLALGAVDYARAQERRLAFHARMCALMEEVDLLLCPPSMLQTPLQEGGESAPGDFRIIAEFLRFTAPFNLSGNPTITLRSDFDASGMPVAVQLIGRHFDEALLVRAGSAHERGTPACERVPDDPTETG